MLVSVSIRNIVLIDRLDLTFGGGLCVLTGETGAGKSILLDALCFVTGARSDRGLVRAGAEQGNVSAIFDPPPKHPARALLTAQGIVCESDIILRRSITPEGRTRAFINDDAVSASLLRQVGGLLFEVHGQHDEQGLLSPSAHRALLDEFGVAMRDVLAAASAFEAWRAARERLAETEARAREAALSAEYVRHAAEELRRLMPEEGEEEQLAQERALRVNAERIAGDLQGAVEILTGSGGLESRLSQSLRRLERAAAQAPGRLDAVAASLARALVEVGEARAQAEAALSALDFDAQGLERIDDRLAALREAARKFRVPVSSLPALAADFAQKLSAIDEGGAVLAQASENCATARETFLTASRQLSLQRERAARALEKAVTRELPALKLEKARFRILCEALGEEAASPFGLDRVTFEISTNPGAPFGPLQKIASGGELARFVLALKVALSEGRAQAALVFDEIDQGVGGAVAAAVGARLARLAAGAQVIIVTHSPQIAARADLHWRIQKTVEKGQAVTRVTALSPSERREEIARMLSGTEVTPEARSAAERLMKVGEGS
ncbi:MAG: DNA repair protein RecN [Alphaproteobacteria bacterium]|nr:DNA repair protein RecN [Alphaproteobacteria bacterium]